MGLYMLGFITIFPRLARNTPQCCDLREVYEAYRGVGAGREFGKKSHREHQHGELATQIGEFDNR
jgi:hypothetical protein